MASRANTSQLCFPPSARVAPPGGMTGSASQAMDVVQIVTVRYNRGGFQGGDRAGSHRAGPWRMAGSAFQAMDVVSILTVRYNRGVPRGEYTGSRLRGPWRIPPTTMPRCNETLISGPPRGSKTDPNRDHQIDPQTDPNTLCSPQPQNVKLPELQFSRPYEPIFTNFE